MVDSRVTPLNRVWWRVHRSFHLYINGEYAESTTQMDEAGSIALTHGLKSVLFEIYHSEAIAAQGAGDQQAAEASMTRLESALNPARRMDLAYYHNLKSGLEMLRGEYRRALEDSSTALRLAEESGMPGAQHPHFIARMASAHIKLQEYDPALECYERAIARSTGVDVRNFTHSAMLLRAHVALLNNRQDEGAALLREGFAGMRREAYVGLFRLVPELLSALCSQALERGIETEFAQHLVRKRGLQPVNRDLESWPWRLRIYTLGRFSVVRDGEPLVFTGKAQKRPLDLLKALVALGGRDVDTSALIHYLWPDAEGGDGKSSFDSNLYRLRKLLNLDAAIELQDSKLTLDPNCCWVDAWAFERLANRAEAHLRGCSETDAARLGEALLGTYQGHFLDREAVQPWLMPTRDRLQAKFQRTIFATARYWEEAGKWQRAASCYQRSLELDNLAEPVYRRLMICHREMGNRAEALKVYRRCREMLSIVLGVSPSDETEQLHRELLTA
jgi:LuxR family maltose regulon positive regulatory protein